MTGKHEQTRDSFRFSLEGLKTTRSIGLATAIADDRINRAIDRKMQNMPENQPDTAKEIAKGWGRFWLRRRAA